MSQMRSGCCVCAADFLTVHDFSESCGSSVDSSRT